MHAQHLAEHVGWSRVVRQEAGGLTKRFHRTVQVAFLLERRAQQIMRLAIAGPLRHGGLHLLRRFLEIAELPDRHAEGVMGFRQIAVEPDGFQQFLLRALEIVLLLERQPQIVVPDGGARV